MSKIMWKNLCFPNFIKCLPTIQAPPDQPSNQNPPPPPSTTATCTSLLIKNFNTLYDLNLINSSSSKSRTPSSSSSSADDVHTSSSDSDSDLSPSDFATIFASQRFFFSSPGRSNSITESPHTTTTKPNKPRHKSTLVTKGVRVRKFSSNPYLDFRRSMEGMLEANSDHHMLVASQRFFFSSPGRSNSITESPHTTTTKPDKPRHKSTFVTKGVRVRKFSSNPYLDFRRSMEEMLEANRDHHMLVGHDHYHHSTSDDMEYLHELLLCYLSLNPKHAHKDIISAFTDLVICVLSAKSSAPASASDQRRETPQTH